MTPTEQDNELREKLTKLISQDGWVDIQEVDVDGQVNELVALITADRKRVALEARINEEKRSKQAVMLYRYPARKLAERIAELKAQQEEV